jgi:hypothetical protein
MIVAYASTHADHRGTASLMLASARAEVINREKFENISNGTTRAETEPRAM